MRMIARGCSRRAIRARIEERAVAIATFGLGDRELHDPTDINHGEDAEIKAARALAEMWLAGASWLTDAGDVWHVYTAAAARDNDR